MCEVGYVTLNEPPLFSNLLHANLSTQTKNNWLRDKVKCLVKESFDSKDSSNEKNESMHIKEV
jgi:hypothetical protein